MYCIINFKNFIIITVFLLSFSAIVRVNESAQRCFCSVQLVVIYCLWRKVQFVYDSRVALAHISVTLNGKYRLGFIQN